MEKITDKDRAKEKSKRKRYIREKRVNHVEHSGTFFPIRDGCNSSEQWREWVDQENNFFKMFSGDEATENEREKV